MSEKGSRSEGRAIVEGLEGRRLLSVSPLLAGAQTFRTHTALTVDAGTLGQPITFTMTVFADIAPFGGVNLYYHGKLLQGLALSFKPVASPDPRFASENATTYTVPAGPVGAKMFGVGPHAVRAEFPTQTLSFFTTTFLASSAVAHFRVMRPQFVTQPSGVGIATVDAGSGPALQPGQMATVQYNAYLAATYRLFYSTQSQTPDTSSFVVDANPEQVIPGLDAGVVGMQAGETRAIYVPYKLAHGAAPKVSPRANLVYLVTLVSIG
ncbi:MAG TPA: FKBP-type peptidyl-prolyl cis-trans isomerase [Tepidisphaeraceae bacterium]